MRWKDKFDIIIAWNEADEVREDLAFSDEEIIKMLPEIRLRIKTICIHLQDLFTNDEFEEVYPQSCRKCHMESDERMSNLRPNTKKTIEEKKATDRRYYERNREEIRRKQKERYNRRKNRTFPPLS
jgi:hypothetical protein